MGSTFYLWEGKFLIVDGKFAVNEDCCCGEPVPECPYCDTGHMPEQVTVTRAGIVPSDPVWCAACNARNGDFVLGLPEPGSKAEAMVTDPAAWNNHEVHCVRGLVLDPHRCIGQFDEESEIILFFDFTGGLHVIAYSAVAGGNVSPSFAGVITDCEAWNNTPVPLVQQGNFSCDTNGATCLLTV